VKDMLRDALVRRVLLWCASMLGAALFASAIAAFAVPAAQNSVGSYAVVAVLKMPQLLLLRPGASALAGTTALAAVTPALAASLTVMLPSLLIAIALGTLLGFLLTLGETRALLAPLFQLIASIPIFCASLMIAAGFALLRMPVAVTAPIIATLSLAVAGAVARAVFAAQRSAAPPPYIDGLARMGLSRRQIVGYYVARPTLAVALRDAGNILLALFAATAVVESVFSWPGAGAGFIRAVALGDWNVVAVLIMIMAAARFTVDLAAGLLSQALLGEEPPA
jgi:ABC-type dipeptide/oligopeptide/nickel transport system permease component